MSIEHGSACKKPDIVLRLSWGGEPEQACRNCGKYAPALDQRTINLKRETK